MNQSENFVEEIFSDEAENQKPVVLSRSDLERDDSCPFKAHAVEHDLVVDAGELADAGTEGHDIISEAMPMFIAGMEEREIREHIADYAMAARTDVQQIVLDALSRGAWLIANEICRRPDGSSKDPEDIMQFDGGKDRQSGQLARDFLSGDETTAGIRLTCEVDLLTTGYREVEAVMHDWKTGFKEWDSDDIRKSFQFQFYSYLVFAEYPGLERIQVRIVMPRWRYTAVTEFDKRRDLAAIHTRLVNAVGNRKRRHAAEAKDETPDCWPDPKKCSICPALAICPVATGKYPIAQTIQEDRVKALATAIAVDKLAGEWMKAIKESVKEDGPIRLPNGKDFPLETKSFAVSKLKF